MHMTSQKGAPVVLGVKRGTPRAPSPSMHSEGKPLHASPPSWPGCAHWLRGWAPMRSASKTCARSATSLDPQHGVVVMETWRQCIRSIVSSENGHKWYCKGFSKIKHQEGFDKIVLITLIFSSHFFKCWPLCCYVGFIYIYFWYLHVM